MSSQALHPHLATPPVYITTIQELGMKANGDPYYSVQQAEKDFGILRSSLSLCLKGKWFIMRPLCITHSLLGGKSCQEAHVDEQLLTAAQEEVLVKWIKVQGHHGVPMTYASVAQSAAEISGKPVGENWPRWFCEHHPDLKMKKMVGLEKACAKALNQFMVNEFFDMLTDVIQEYNITPGNIYNMDKKGIQLGISVRVTAMVDQDQKAVYSIEDGNRELVTVIKCICADGSAIHPSMIFQGQQQNAEWG
jgi:hypothetical protein